MMSDRGRHLPADRTPATRTPGCAGEGRGGRDRPGVSWSIALWCEPPMRCHGEASGRQRIMALRGAEGHFFFPPRRGLFEESSPEW